MADPARNLAESQRMSMKRSPEWLAEYERKQEQWRVKRKDSMSGGRHADAGLSALGLDHGGANPPAHPISNIEFIGDSAIRKDAQASHTGRLASGAGLNSPPIVCPHCGKSYDEEGEAA